MTYSFIQRFLVVFIGAAILFSPVNAPAQQDTNQVKEIKSLGKKERAPAKSIKVDSPIIVELFTSSDCSACVHADRLLYDIAKEKNIIALSCRVQDLNNIKNKPQIYTNDEADYKTPMDPCVFRQWTYTLSSRLHETTTSVPTFYINGTDKLPSNDFGYLATNINSFGYAPKNKAHEVMMRWKDDKTIALSLPNATEKYRGLMNVSLWLIRYKDIEVEKINDGVNKGRVLRFSNVIQDIKHVGKWYGNMREIDVLVAPASGRNNKGGYVIIGAEMLGEPILAAGRVEDYPVAGDQPKTP